MQFLRWLFIGAGLSLFGLSIAFHYDQAVAQTVSTT
jgi:hypothetical protein